jgi:hypothetical protein
MVYSYASLFAVTLIIIKEPILYLKHPLALLIYLTYSLRLNDILLLLLNNLFQFF